MISQKVHIWLHTINPPISISFSEHCDADLWILRVLPGGKYTNEVIFVAHSNLVRRRTRL